MYLKFIKINYMGNAVVTADSSDMTLPTKLQNAIYSQHFCLQSTENTINLF